MKIPSFLHRFRPEQPAATTYQRLGGEPVVRAIANRFYDIMSTDPAAKELYALHPLPLDTIRQKFYEFLSGWFEGPQLYIEKHGHPMLRARHLPFPIDVSMRDQWLLCMYQTLDELVPDAELKHELRQRFTRLAHHMINQ